MEALISFSIFIYSKNIPFNQCVRPSLLSQLISFFLGKPLVWLHHLGGDFLLKLLLPGLHYCYSHKVFYTGSSWKEPFAGGSKQAAIPKGKHQKKNRLSLHPFPYQEFLLKEWSLSPRLFGNWQFRKNQWRAAFLMDEPLENSMAFFPWPFLETDE